MNKNKFMPILMISAFLIGLDSLVVAPLVPAISGDIGFPLSLGGLLVTAYSLMYGLSASLFGPVSDRWGRKKMMLLGMFFFALGTVLTGLGTNLEMLLIFRGIAGLGGAMLMPSVFAFIGDKFAYEQRGKAMGMIMGALVGSTVIGVPLGTFLAQYTSWKITFFFLGGFAFLMFFLILKGIPTAAPKRELPGSPVKIYLAQFGAAFSNLSVFFALLSTFLWNAGLHGMFAYIGVYYKQNFDLNVSKIGLVIFAAGLASVIGNALGGRLADKFGKKVIVIIAALIAAAGVLTFSMLTKALVLAIIVHVIWSFSIGFGQSSLTALISELNPKVRGTVLALNSSVMYLGMMVATAVSAVILNNQGFVGIGIMCALASLLVVPITFVFVKESSVQSTSNTSASNQ